MADKKLHSVRVSSALIPSSLVFKLKYYIFFLTITLMIIWIYLDVKPPKVSYHVTYKLQTKQGQEFNDNPNRFHDWIKSFPWDNYHFAMKTNNLTVFAQASQLLFKTILPFLIMPPKVKVNETCKSPDLVYPNHVPKCERLTNPRKVAVLLQLGFDVDILEIHLHELYELVDYFFLLESTRSHLSGSPKPLIWEHLKGQPRFSQFESKVVHLILDDSELAEKVLVLEKHGSLKNLPRFGIEFLQERRRFEKFIEWNNATQHFQEDDLIGIGDTDEIPNRNLIYYLKNCEMPSDPVDIGIWFPFGRINQVFQTDWPVKGHPYTYGDPTYWTLKTALKLPHGKFPSRQRGKSPGFLLGGMHMTHYGYLPFQLVKSMSVSDANANRTRNVTEKLINMKSQKDLFELEQYLGEAPEKFLPRILNITTFAEKYPQEYENIVKFPWWYDCNRDRYPAWEGKHDERLD